jgi:hypothetical protein
LAICLPPAIAKPQQHEEDCGSDRWSVKIMRDPDARYLRPQIVRTTVKILSGIPIPEIAYPLNGRIAPEELTVYRVRGIVDQIIVEDDRDWHIVLRDPESPAISMIVEIPDPRCVANTKLQSMLIDARKALHSVPRKGIAEFDGVGFFDFIHTQRGRARNGFELHPVLAVRVPPVT